MRRKIMIPLVMPLLVLPLLGGCVSSDHLVASKPADPSTIEEFTSLRENAPDYTTHHAATAKPEIVRIAIDDQFDMYERAKILRAVNEWNQVLNGFVNFDIDPKADQEPVWVIVPMHGGRPPPVRGMIFGHALASYPAAHPSAAWSSSMSIGCAATISPASCGTSSAMYWVSATTPTVA